MCDSIREYVERIFCSIQNILNSNRIYHDYNNDDIKKATLKIKELLEGIKNNGNKEYKFIYDERIVPNWQYGANDEIFHYGENKISIFFYINFNVESGTYQLSHCCFDIERQNDYNYDKITKFIKNIFRSQWNCFVPSDITIQEIINNIIKNSQKNQGEFIEFAIKRNDYDHLATLEQFFIQNKSEIYLTKQIITYKKMEL